MLVLSRKISESIQIGSDIVITVTQISKGMVKLGIVAPAHIRILRGELTKTPATVSIVAGTSQVTEPSEIEETDVLSGDEPPLDFGTEYAAQIEDQMRCVMAV
jgi:carbon storage regulator